MKNTQRIFFIGAGSMGRAILEGMLKNTGWSPEQIICVRSSNNRQGIPEGIALFTGIDALPGDIEGDIVLLCVKPQIFAEISSVLKTKLVGGNLLISVMAGVSIRSIAERLGAEPSKIVRSMPNLPASIGAGMTAVYSSPSLSAEDREMSRKILAGCGGIYEVPDEDSIDKATAVTGSGSGYCFYFAEAMVSQAEAFGFPPEDARRIVTGTLKGAAELLEQNSGKAEELRRKVTSRKGTTEAAIESFEASSLKKIIGAGMQAAYNRARAISKETDGI